MKAIRALLLVLAVACGPRPDAPPAEPDAADADAAVAGDAVIEAEFYSPALGRTNSYLVYLPPGYGADGRRYPTLYLLHGIGGSNREWLGYGADTAASCLAAAPGSQPLLIVLPQGDEGYWLNHAADGPRWGDYVARDLVAHVDATYRTLPDPGHRAVGGLSMGGHGALQLAFNYPDVFGVAGAHSPTLRPRAEAPEYFADAATFPRVDPISLARRGDGATQVRIWVDAGDADPWLGRIERLHDVLDARGIAHAWHIWEGEHASDYWTAHVADYLAYYSQALTGEAADGAVGPDPAALTACKK